MYASYVCKSPLQLVNSTNECFNMTVVKSALHPRFPIKVLNLRNFCTFFQAIMKLVRRTNFVVNGYIIFLIFIYSICRSQWLRGLRRRSAAAPLLRLWVRILPGDMDVCCECCVLSGRGLCDELITRPEDSYRLWCVIVCDLETS